MNRGRLAQRLENPVYTRKVVRSNRTSPPIRCPYRGDVVQLVRTLPCHGRGREFESRRPRHSFQSLTRCPFGAFPVHFEDWAHFSEGRQEIAGVFSSAQAPSAMAGTRSGDSDKTSRLSLVGSCSRTTID